MKRRDFLAGLAAGPTLREGGTPAHRPSGTGPGVHRTRGGRGTIRASQLMEYTLVSRRGAAGRRNRAPRGPALPAIRLVPIRRLGNGVVALADAQQDFVIVVSGNCFTAQAAIADAFARAAQFAPYEIVGHTVEPLYGGWVCILELVQIG